MKGLSRTSAFASLIAAPRALNAWKGLGALCAAMIVGVTAAAILFTGCEPVEYFTEYEGVNLIAHQQFSSGDWEVSYGEATVTFDYLVFEPVSATEAGTTEGLPSGAEDDMYRLELVNLFPNGDFEATTVGEAPAGWTVNDASTQDIQLQVVGTSDSNAITGQTMWYATVDYKDNISYNLSNSRDGLVSKASYIVRFDYITLIQDTPLEYTKDAVAALQNFLDAKNVSTAFRFPEDSEIYIDEDITTFSFLINSSVTTYAAANLEGYMDNVRLIRTEIYPTLSLILPIEDSSRPDLVPGAYTFSFYFKEEIDSNITPTTPNRFRAKALQCKIVGSSSMNRSEDFETAVSGQTSYTWDTWHEISFEVFIDNTVLGETLEAPGHLELQITPTDLTKLSVLDAGSILIAAPSLMLTPE